MLILAIKIVKNYIAWTLDTLILNCRAQKNKNAKSCIIAKGMI